MLFIYFYLISFSLIGYGLLTTTILKINLNNFGSLGFLGISSLTIISYLSSLFIPHNFLFNTIIICFGLISLIYFYKKISNLKKEILNYLFVFITLSIFIAIGKTHDDFSYYHFAYTQLITEYSHPIGMGSLNNGFRNPSSLFFLSSIFYLPKISYYLFHIAPAFFLGFANLFLLNNIFNKNSFKDLRFVNFLSLIFFIFVNIFFYRLAEHGTDRSGLIIAICLIILLFIIVNNNSEIFDYKSHITLFLILLCLLISLKPFYLIYASFFLVLLIYKNTQKIIIELLFSKIFFYCLLFIFFIILYTFINSGCVIFPLTFTCFENLDWSTSKETVEGVRVWYELWSKAGANPHFIIEDKITYISGFNWLSNWLEVYFFNKVSDFLIGLLVLLMIFYFTFYLKKLNGKIVLKNKIRYLPIYILITLCFCEWFMNHPSLRYGGYHLIPLILYIPLCMHLGNFYFNKDFFIKKAIVLIIITSIVFLSRNVLRLSKEFNKYAYNPFVSTKFIIDYNLLFKINRIYKINVINKNGLSKYKKVKILGKNFIIIKN